MRIITGKKASKTSRGYRLKLTTHRLIDKMQLLLQCSQDDVITNACRKYYDEIRTNRINTQKGELK